MTAADNAKKSWKETFWSVLATNLLGFRKKPHSLRIAVLRRMRLGSWTNRLALLLTFAAVISGFATYGALNAAPPFGNDPNTVIWLLNIDLIILLALAILTARRIVGIWSGRKRGVAGSRLHVRLVFIFSVLAAAPAIIMTIFAAFFLHFGVQSWFSDRVRTAINESQAVAEAYLQEHMQAIRADIMAMAYDLDRQSQILSDSPEAFEKVLKTQSMLRNLPDAIVFDINGGILARTGATSTLALDTIPPQAIKRAQNEEIVIITGGKADDRVRALLELRNFGKSYLLVGRMIDAKVLQHVRDTRDAVTSYEKLEGQRSGLQVKITMIFLVVALLLLFAAIWFGLMFARQLVIPIGALITAADRVRAGDLTARAPEFERKDEFDVLGFSFNRMTSQIQEQRDELIAANRQLDERRRFTETVLAGVSAGVIGIDRNQSITLANDSAAELFGTPVEDLTGRNVADILPGLIPVLEQAKIRPDHISQAQIPYLRKDEIQRTLLFRIALDEVSADGGGAVLTFDDITELQSAQRKAAWSDVARRIAHEIKNPLTPIQLSAERLKRKYMSQITQDREIFSQCTDTIIHHVDDIGRMVNEFSNFARMPEPVMRRGDVTSEIRNLIVLQQQAHPEIKFIVNHNCGTVQARFDAQQMRQAFTNVIQNAIDSIHARKKKKEGEGKIEVLLSQRGADLLVSIMDDGVGLPKNVNPERLTEPYVTHKERGTGLGLAIVKKIMEDHQGRVVIGAPDWLKKTVGWHDHGGATVTLVIPIDEAAFELSRVES